MTTYFGFAFSPAMLATFPIDINFQELDVATQKANIEAAISCLNPSHTATIAVLNSRFNLTIEIPDVAPRVSLHAGDSMYIFQVIGLPRLGADRKEYTHQEIESATFKLLLATIG